MAEAQEEAAVGGFFSRTYLSAEKPFSDDGRARHRMAAYLGEYYSNKHYEIGKFIEQELGIKCLRRGATQYYIDWPSFLKDRKRRPRPIGISLAGWFPVRAAGVFRCRERSA